MGTFFKINREELFRIELLIDNKGPVERTVTMAESNNNRQSVGV
jgi:hypothetical protein